MLQITEDTPPDMLAGAMDLTVHLPTGGSVKMSVERSTPMMDLLVQVATAHQLQLSGHTLQVLGMAPSKERDDAVLPYKPNTPIGTLDTQHMRVVAKPRAVPAPKNVPPGRQPFESTFRLKVHLPRNQLYVTRVSQHVHLGDIMRKVCEEKNLDALKYEFRHPGNLDEILDPKLTLSDYTITEIYLVQKGSNVLSQAFSASDIMALRKEEERKQMQSKTGGGVFNLIFKRGKSSTGSLSSDNRSISPTHSDDSRSVTPPGVQQQIIAPPPEPPAERPKPPQRKRRPAPKPPKEPKRVDLTICHSRNSSDSSGYHEASILSDHCNTSLTRRPKSTIITEETQRTLSGVHSRSTSNLTKMSAQSKSTSSLAFPNRKKKAAPAPPPPVLKPEPPQMDREEPSPVVASQPSVVAQAESLGIGRDDVVVTNPKPAPRARSKTAPNPRPRSLVSVTSEEGISNVKTEDTHQAVNPRIELQTKPETNRQEVVEFGTISRQEQRVEVFNSKVKSEDAHETVNPNIQLKAKPDVEVIKETNRQQVAEIETLKEEQNVKAVNSKVTSEDARETVAVMDEEPDVKIVEVQAKRKQLVAGVSSKAAEEDEELKKEKVKPKSIDIKKTAPPDERASQVKPPEVVALHPKTRQDRYAKSMFDSYTRKRGFQIGSSLLKIQSLEEAGKHSGYRSESSSDTNSVASALNSFDFVDEIEEVLDVEMFTGSLSKSSKNRSVILHQLHGMHEFDKDGSGGSLRSASSVPSFLNGGGMKKWRNVEGLDDISVKSSGWVAGDTSDTDSTASATRPTPVDSSTRFQSPPPTVIPTQEQVEETVIPPKHVEEKALEQESEWQYTLPSPPRAFRDSSPVAFAGRESVADSVVTSPELFEKLQVVRDSRPERGASDATSTVSEDDRPILSKLSLEHLEKRRSLVYNRELATSLKMREEEGKPDAFSSSLASFEKEYGEMKRPGPREAVAASALPNFKITTYDNPKKKLNIFEDDTVRSNVGKSVENLYRRKSSAEEEFKKPQEYTFFRPPAARPQTVFRSESFSKEPRWSPSRPVTRSKSQVALNVHKVKQNVEQDENLTKSNSLFDVSGLQSLGVMRLIQTKLNTPQGSTEHLDKEPRYQKQPDRKNEVQTHPEPAKANQPRVPAINMGTWSDRPKVPVNVKEDPDYRYSVKDTHAKLLVNTFHNRVKSFNAIEVKHKAADNVGVDGESISGQNTGNVVIKIGNVARKPLANVENHQRPHSVAFGAGFDISRVPIVRSVELKKPFKEFHNTSVTQIYQNGGGLFTPNGHGEAKPTFRTSNTSNYLQNASAPVVRGFRGTNGANAQAWAATLPAKSAFAANSTVPFSQSNLRRTESIKSEVDGRPPAAPAMPKAFAAPRVESCDPKEQLLRAIRDFGGKKGLRSVEA